MRAPAMVRVMFIDMVLLLAVVFGPSAPALALAPALAGPLRRPRRKGRVGAR